MVEVVNFFGGKPNRISGGCYRISTTVNFFYCDTKLFLQKCAGENTIPEEDTNTILSKAQSNKVQ